MATKRIPRAQLDRLRRVMVELARLWAEGRRFEALARSPFSQVQLLALFWLSEEGEMASSQLARLVGVTPPTCTRLVDGLVAHGLVERVRGERDRRVVMLRLTPAGREASAMVQDMFLQKVVGFLEPLGRGDREALIAIFERLVGAMARRLDEAGRTGVRR